MRFALTLLFAFCCLPFLKAQSSAFRPVAVAERNKANLPERARLFELDAKLFSQQLAAKNTALQLPLPDGGYVATVPNADPVLEASLAARYPQLGSYALRTPAGTGRLATAPGRVDILLPTLSGFVAYEPVADLPQTYAVYYVADDHRTDGITPLGCGFEDNLLEGADAGVKGVKEEVHGDPPKSLGDTPRELRQYDLAITCTGEFARKVGGDREDVMAAYNTAVNVLNALFIREFGTRMRLIEASDRLIYLDPATDAFVDASLGRELLDQVIRAFEANNVPVDAYDLGHLFTAGCSDVGGVVNGTACSNAKTRGVTCHSGNDIARLARGTMAHEIAHQFAVSHSWNNCPGSQEQRSGQTAWEPGSGTTIMSYAGACRDQNIGAGDAYYHVGSIQQFLTFSRSSGASDCATVIETENRTPDVTIDYENNFFVPISTPFVLEGTATDDNDPLEQLTYNWEQFDLGPDSRIQDPEQNAPLFRSVPPSAGGNVRYFPRLSDVILGINRPAETLPDYARRMTFRLTARDNNEEAGGVDWESFFFRTTEEAGPFVVNQPDTTGLGSWRIGQSRTITWDVAGTDQAPVNARTVDILASANEGETFDIVVARGVPNTGSVEVNVPLVPFIGQATEVDILLMIRASDNIFFNLAPEPIRVEAATEPSFALEQSLSYADVCAPDVVTVEYGATAILDYNEELTLDINTEELPEGATANLSRNSFLPGETSTLTLDFTDAFFTGRVRVPVTVTAPDRDTTFREIIIDVQDNDFSDLALLEPAEGTSGIILATDFNWTEAANARRYDLQIATSPTFSEGSIFEEATQLTDTEFIPQDFFAENTVYFWRVRPENRCGPGEWSDPQSFRTVSVDCSDYAAEDLPVGLPGNGPSFTATSELFVREEGNISDLNIPMIDIRYQVVANLTVRLTSPGGTTVTLYDRNCFSTNNIVLGFDDEAPRNLVCPPDDRRVFIPVGSLADFNGEETLGTWTLTVIGSETGGSAGSIRNWGLEFCTSLAAQPLSVLTNETTRVGQNERVRIGQSQLEVRSEDFGSDRVFHTIVRLPRFGTLDLYGRELMVGDTFDQAKINGNGLHYRNTNPDTEFDDFAFVVSTPTGGYLPVTYHEFAVQAEPVSTNGSDNGFATSLTVFPNPATDQVQIHWNGAVAGAEVVNVSVFDLNGRLLLRQSVGGALGQATVSLGNLSAGVYVLRIGGATRRVVVR